MSSRRLCVASVARSHANQPDRGLRNGADATYEPLWTRRAMQLTATRSRAQFRRVLEAHRDETHTPRSRPCATTTLRSDNVRRARPKPCRIVQCPRDDGGLSAHGMVPIRRPLTKSAAGVTPRPSRRVALLTAAALVEHMVLAIRALSRGAPREDAVRLIDAGHENTRGHQPYRRDTGEPSTMRSLIRHQRAQTRSSTRPPDGNERHAVSSRPDHRQA